MDALNQRYSRHILLPNFTPSMQQKLFDAKVLVIGAGGLACPVLEYLNAAGVGTIGITDGDIVSLSNLQRQTLYTETDVNNPKCQAAKTYLNARNSATKVNTYNTFISPENAIDIVAHYDVVVDCSDNFGTRYLVNDACVILNKPFVYASLLKYTGQVAVFNYKGSATYRCLFPEAPSTEEMPACNEAGVLGIVAGLMGSLQALETIKLITGLDGLLRNKLLQVNYLNHTQNIIEFEREEKWLNWDGKNIHPTYDIPCLLPSLNNEIEASELDTYLAKGWHLIDVRTEMEFEAHNIGGQNIPLDTIEDGKYPAHNYLLLCQSGIRSMQAQKTLAKSFPNKNFRSIKKGLTAF